jgi:hypothetical protein
MPEMLGIPLVDLAVVAGVALVLPACCGGPWPAWALVAVATAAAGAAGDGSAVAVALALPWPALALVLTAGVARSWRAAGLVRLVACGDAVVAGTWFALSRAEATPLGIGEPIVLLTAVHFTYAGAGALTLAGTARDRAAGPWSRRVATAGVALTAAAPPVVATGFVTEAAIPQVGGAILLSLGVFATAAVQLAQAVRAPLAAGARVLLAVSGLSVWAPMVLAVAWAAGQHWTVRALSIPDMVRVHGTANAVGFVGAGLLARRSCPVVGARGA